MRPFYVYILRCADGSYYTGQTDDVEKRVGEHQQGSKCVYTTTRRPVELAWCGECSSREYAIMSETRINSWNRAKREALIRGDIPSLVAAAKKKDWKAYRSRHDPANSIDG